MERRRIKPNGVAAVPCVFPVLRPYRRSTRLPAVPTQRGLVSGRSVQHRFLLAVNVHGRTGMPLKTGHLHSYVGGCAYLQKSLRSRSNAVVAHTKRTPDVDVGSERNGHR